MAHVIPAVRFLDPATLLTTLSNLAAHRATSNLRAVASQWNKHYSAALLRPILSAMTIDRVALDGSLENVSITIADSGMPESPVLTDPTPAPNSPDLRRQVLTGVLTNHLVPLIDQLRMVTGVPRRVLWGSVANVIAELYDNLAKHPEAARAAAEDRSILLDSPVDLLTHGPNPLYNLVRYDPIAVPGLPPRLRARQVCCQRWLLPDDKPCASCPRRSLDDRIGAAMHKKKRREALR